jgi:hypothetical protein
MNLNPFHVLGLPFEHDVAQLKEVPSARHQYPGRNPDLTENSLRF